MFALPDERRLPGLCHAGRGIPALGRHAIEACERHPGMRLILAHAGISDPAWIRRLTPDHPNLLLDTAWWSPSDLQALSALIAPGQILAQRRAVRHADVGRHDDVAARAPDRVGRRPGARVPGGQAARLIAGEDLLDLGPAPWARTGSRGPPARPRALVPAGSLGQMFNGIEPTESLALATLACEVGDEDPRAEVCRSILGLIEERRGSTPPPGGDGRPERFRARAPLHRRRGRPGPDARRGHAAAARRSGCR